MKSFAIVLFGMLMFSNIVLAVDPLNTYQWNRGKPGAIATDTKPWFEWWYYKVVLPDTGKSFFFIYGIVNPWDHGQTQKASRAYVGFGDFENRQMLGQDYPVTEFQASYQQVDVVIAGNTATDKRIKASIKDTSGATVSWDMTIEKRWAFNATSWATGHNITNIEWHPAQADARCSGEVLMDGEIVSFQDAPCYQDRNWGRSFPAWWTWIVSNEFENSIGTALAVGGGRPLYFGLPIPYEGVAIGLRYQGEEIAFRPNEFHPVFIDIEFGKWYARAYNSKYKIEISATAGTEDFMDLQFMTPTGELFHDYETLTGQVEVKLYRKKGAGWQPMPVLYSKYAGIEFGSSEVYSLERLRNSRIPLYRSAAAEILEGTR